MWRALKESLPTKGNLFSRHITPDKVCSLCEEHLEDTIHCLWLCDAVKGIWLTDPSFSLHRTKTYRSFGELVSAVLIDSCPATAALFSMVAWSLWIRRNRIRERQWVWEVGDTVQRARELLQEFWDVQARPSRLPGRRT